MMKTSTGTMICPLQHVFLLEVDMGPAEPGGDETEDNKGGVAQVSDSPNCPAGVTTCLANEGDPRRTSNGELVHRLAVRVRQLARRRVRACWRRRFWGKCREGGEQGVNTPSSYKSSGGISSAGKRKRLLGLRYDMTNVTVTLFFIGCYSNFVASGMPCRIRRGIVTPALQFVVHVALEVWSSAGMKGREKREIPEKTRRPKASYGTIPTCENPVTRPGIEPGSPWWDGIKEECPEN
ncbi:hypothetical protein PR048_008842 [Dryococelus australis]|uniref:Uncharacterized protein n=1 Tax=Dryococelus australis TaxID=614101 RepID=A0ABQ9I023_9NEOP|nr:hypothetical protein PR048_008842 [Dryococelus australis]